MALRRRGPAGASADSAVQRPGLSAPRSGFFSEKTLPRSPYIKAGRLPQEKVFQDELPFARDKRLAANSACYFQIDGLGARWSFGNLVKRKAA